MVVPLEMVGSRTASRNHAHPRSILGSEAAVALKNLLPDWGADVAGPVATTVEAERLISEHAPDVALVDSEGASGPAA